MDMSDSTWVTACMSFTVGAAAGSVYDLPSLPSFFRGAGDN
jgi:hypothetical protein